VAALLAVIIPAATLLASCESTSPPSPAPVPTASPSAPVPSPSPPEAFEIALGRVRGSGVAAKPRRPATWRAARAVRAVMTEVYSAGFLETDRGSRPLLRSFAAEARAAAKDDLEALTLGKAAPLLDTVRPRVARLDVHVVADDRGRMVSAFATMHFKAIGLAGTARLPVGQEATYLLHRSTAGWRIEAYEAVSHVPTPDEVERATHRAELDPAIPSTGPMFVLVIGSDARPGADPAHGLADSLHIVGVDPRTGTASILGIPRDSFVPIPGLGTDKINASLARGGPDLVVRTVERLSGIHIDGYVLTGFAGFERLVDAIGPIAIDVPYAMNDPSSHAEFRPGRTELNAREALAFSRDRHDAPGGDFGRSLNQGRLLVAALATLRADLRAGDLAVLPWILAGARHLETDLDLWQMLELLLSAPAVDPGAVRIRVVPGRTATIGGRSIVLLAPEARAMFRDLARDGVLGP
jgi:LCP family protein required for cell wall assembly